MGLESYVGLRSYRTSGVMVINLAFILSTGSCVVTFYILKIVFWWLSEEWVRGNRVEEGRWQTKLHLPKIISNPFRAEDFCGEG